MTIRPLIHILPFVLMPGYLVAQDEMIEHRFHADQLPDAVLVKHIHEVVHALDPKGTVSIHHNLMKARLNDGVPHGELMDALNALGPVLFISGWPARTVDRTAASGLAFPVPVDTGDPVQDSISFALAKQAWARSHPHAMPGNGADQ